MEATKLIISSIINLLISVLQIVPDTVLMAPFILLVFISVIGTLKLMVYS